MPSSLLIVGASVRAAVQSAVHSGLDGWGADLFADTDTAACAHVDQVADYPKQFAKIADAAPQGPWMYTGGLENHPRLIEKIAATRPLWGNGRTVLERVRDPIVLSQELARTGLPAVEVVRDHRSIPKSENWVRKPLHSCAGLGISHWTASTVAGEAASFAKKPHYYQQFINGPSMAVLFLADGKNVTFLGALRQLIGQKWGNDTPFGYCGSIGPIPLPFQLRAQIETLGKALTDSFQLRGLFGVDGILSASGDFWAVEVNPRYTASAEVLERAYHVPMVGLHADCFSESPAWPAAFPSHSAEIMVGKAIYFAHGPLSIGATFCEFAARQNANKTYPAVADIPRLGAAISKGQPVATVLGCGKNFAETKRDLRIRLEQLKEALLADNR